MITDTEKLANLHQSLADKEAKFRKLVTPLGFGYDPGLHDELFVIEILAKELKIAKDRIRSMERGLTRIYITVSSQMKYVDE
jgi:hypothetical protein